MEEINKLSLIKNFAAGGVSGVCLVLVGHPFDTIKVNLLCNIYKKTRN